MRSRVVAALSEVSVWFPGLHPGAPRRNTLVVFTYVLLALLGVGAFGYLV